MDDLLSEAKPDAWYKIVAITGGLALPVSIGAGSTPAILISLGLLGIGSGEWSSRVRRPQVGPHGVMGLTLRVWRPSGIILDVIGALLLGLGIYRLLFPA
jgi:hypothetical protein